MQSALELCAERGYGAVTMEAIATHAKVGKPTLYRWWPSKASLILDALLEDSGDVFAVPDTGDIRADLRTMVVRVCELVSDPRRKPVLSGVIGGAQTDPPTAEAVRGIHNHMRPKNQQRIVAAQRAGQLPSMNPEVMEDLLISAMWYRLLISGAAIGPDFADDVVEAVLGPAR